MEKEKKQNLWFLAGLLGIGLILFWRCFYSVNTTDEAYYIGTVYRLWFGDGMLCDEWNPTQQMCSFWLYPFYVLFRVILGSNDGMILAFRLLYIVFQLFISGYLYQKLKSYGFVSFPAIFFYLLSTAFNINSLSYNTMANSALVALLVTLAMMEKPDWKNCIWCGIFASIVVMGNPYAVVAYVLYGIVCAAVTLILKKSGKEIPVSLQFKTFFRISLTAAGVLVIFLLFTFWHATLERIIKNLPYIVGDQEHVQRWNVKISDYFRYFREHYLGSTIVPIIVSILALIDKNREKHGVIYMGISVISIVPYMIYHGLVSDYVPINLVTVPVCFLGLPAYIVSKRRLSRVFYIWYLPALVYPIIVQITSNTGPLAVSAGFVTAGAASVLLAASWAREQENKILKNILYAVIVLQLAIMLFLRISYVWVDAPLSELTTKVERGAAKGLYTTESTAQYYEEMYDDLDALNMKEEDGLLVVGSEPLLYLYADRQVASYSTWQVYTNETRLYRYYEIHDGEGRFPSVVYCAEADQTIFDSILVEKLLLPMGYEWVQLQHGIAFYTSR
ncbi:MAG: hypothetical protein J6B94_02910 [Lachnospiraceae bacterium]|nr:hypothetical protein [Lachnospiraceae bacterium]